MYSNTYNRTNPRFFLSYLIVYNHIYNHILRFQTKCMLTSFCLHDNSLLISSARFPFYHVCFHLNMALFSLRTVTRLFFMFKCRSNSIRCRHLTAFIERRHLSHSITKFIHSTRIQRVSVLNYHGHSSPL